MSIEVGDKQRPCDVLVISRGNGRGHAVPDMAIGRTLAQICPAADIRYASYATGAMAYRSNGYPVIDLGLSEQPPFLHVLNVLSDLLRTLTPRIVVAHEEFAAPVAASIMGVPNIFITDFFIDPTLLPMQALHYTSEVLFIGESGVFTEPPHLAGKVVYVGRAVRAFSYGPGDRLRARQELGLAPGAFVALVQPGGWSEAQVPIMQLLDDAWQIVERKNKRVVWLAGRDIEVVSRRYADDPTVTILEADERIERLFVASDVVITKANRVTVYEAASLGIPSISISALANWPDDVAISRVESNVNIRVGMAKAGELAKAIESAADSRPEPATAVSGGIDATARRIAALIGGSTSSPTYPREIDKAKLPSL